MKVFIVHTMGHHMIHGVFISYHAALDFLTEVREGWNSDKIFIKEYPIDTTIPVGRR